MRETQVLLAHGNGGRQMRELIGEIFVRHLGNPTLDQTADGAVIRLPDTEIVV